MRGYRILSFSSLGLSPNLLPICLFKAKEHLKKQQVNDNTDDDKQEFYTLRVSEENQSKPREEVCFFCSPQKSSFSSSVSLDVSFYSASIFVVFLFLFHFKLRSSMLHVLVFFSFSAFK